jgi:serine/threonine protein kinase
MPIVEIRHHAPDARGASVVLEKRLSARESGEPEAIARLVGEASLLAALNETLGGRVLPRFVAAGEDARGPWLRVERLALPTLAAHLELAGGPLPAAFVERAVPSVLAALAELHEAADARGHLAVVHGDPSPANLAFDATGERAALLDLDLALWRDAPVRDGAFRGTLAYAAPEVARGALPDVRADLFGVAAALLHAITGAAPRRAGSFAALLARAAEEPLLDAARAAELSARGAGHAVLVACLAFAPEDRPVTAREAATRGPR